MRAAPATSAHVGAVGVVPLGAPVEAAWSPRKGCWVVRAGGRLVLRAEALQLDTVAFRVDRRGRPSVRGTLRLWGRLAPPDHTTRVVFDASAQAFVVGALKAGPGVRTTAHATRATLVGDAAWIPGML